MSNEKAKDTSPRSAGFRGLGVNYPISAVRVFGEGVVELVRQGDGGPGGGGVRGKIKYLSSRARSKMLFTLSVTTVEFTSLMTLTYPRIYPSSGAVVKSDLNRLRTAFKRRFGGAIFWFLEFQERGAPHFHIFSTWSHPSTADRVDLARMWVDAQRLTPGLTVCDIVSRETIDQRLASYTVTRHPRTWESIRVPGACVRYAAKYALKPYQKAVPKHYQDVGRFWGCTRGVRESVRTPIDYPINDVTLGEILTGENHTTADWENWPKYLFGVKSLT